MSWTDALESAIAAISKYGGTSAGYRTMLDALIPAASVLKERLTVGDDPVDCFVLSSEAASSGAESTNNMQAQRRIAGLHQVTSIGSTNITDTWEPLEEGLLSSACEAFGLNTVEILQI